MCFALGAIVQQLKAYRCCTLRNWVASPFRLGRPAAAALEGEIRVRAARFDLVAAAPMTSEAAIA